MKISWFCIVACAVLWACGSDDSSKPSNVSSPENSEEKEDKKNDDAKNSGSKDVVDPDDLEDYIKTKISSDVEFSVDSVRNNYQSNYTYYIRTGDVVWSYQKITTTSSSVESVCYDEQKGNCDDYGRLYSPNGNLNTVCPSNTHLPSAEDWMTLESYRYKHSEIKNMLPFKYGGYCEEVKGKIKCSELDVTANYLTSDGKIYTIRKGMTKGAIAKAQQNGYYNVLCVGYPTYVKSKKDLPACEKSQRNLPKQIYVFEEKQNMRCYPDEESWLTDFTETCSNDEKTFVVNDTMMVCRNGSWQLASISDAPEKCTRDNKGKVYSFNGRKYVCGSNNWRLPTALEDSLGVCNSRKSGTFDTLYAGIEIKPYYCDDSTWREAVIEDYVGKCDSTTNNLYDTLEYKNKHYVCHGKGWERYTELEERFGLCSPQKMFMFEDGSYDIDNEKVEYMCDTAGWKKFDQNDILGACDSSRWGMLVEYRYKYFYCSSATYRKWDDFTRYRSTDVSKQDSMHMCYEKTIDRIISGGGSVVGVCDSLADGEIVTFVTQSFPKCEKEGEEFTMWDVTYYCNGDGYWHNYYEDLPKCTVKNLGELAQSKEFGRVACDDDGWRPYTDDEAKYGLCTRFTNKTVVEYKNEKFICHNYGWYRWGSKDTFRVKGRAKEKK